MVALTNERQIPLFFPSMIIFSATMCLNFFLKKIMCLNLNGKSNVLLNNIYLGRFSGISCQVDRWKSKEMEEREQTWEFDKHLGSQWLSKNPSS